MKPLPLTPSGERKIIKRKMDIQLIRKYNVAGPRYTSYPTVPYWDHSPTVEEWFKLVRDTFIATNKEGISLYIHLPFVKASVHIVDAIPVLL